MSGLMPGSGGSLMPRATVPTQSTPAGGFVDDLFFETDDQDYIGFDNDNSVNGRPREIRFTRLLVSDYAHAIGTSPAETNGFIMRNSTAAAAGVQQYSPSIFLAGQGWETTGSSSDEVIFRIEAQPVQGASASVNLGFATSLNGGAYSEAFSLASAGGSSTIYSNFIPDGNVTRNLGASGSSWSVVWANQLVFGASGTFLIQLANSEHGLNTAQVYSNTAARTIELRGNATNSAGNTGASIFLDIEAAPDADYILLAVQSSPDTSTRTTHWSVLGDGRMVLTATASPDTTVPTLANLPTGGTAAQVGWVVTQIGGTDSYIPYWQ